MSERKTDREWSRQLDDALRSDGVVHLVGVGNPVRGDDAAGIEVASRLRSRLGRSPRGMKVHPDVPMPERLLSALASTTDRVVIFDAVEASLPPGSIVCRRLGDSKYGFFATHNVPLRLVPGLEQRLGDFYVVGIQPESLEVREEISDSVNAAIDDVVDFFAEREEKAR